MGRKRKYNTPEEQKEANKAKATRYYWANKEICDKKARENYWKKKTGNNEFTEPHDDAIILPKDESKE